jgi:phytoene desaturase
MGENKKVARIIGSGIAAIAASIRIAKKGYEVHVHEGNSYPGGKLSEIKLGEYRFDAGPSLFTLPENVDALFELCGENPRDHFNYIKKNESCRYFWEDGKCLTAHSSIDKFVSEAEINLGESAQAIRSHLSLAKKQYDSTSEFFLESSLHRLKTYFKLSIFKTILALPSLRLLSTMHGVHSKRFRTSHMVQLFDRYATFNGSSPFKAPGTLCMIPHLEFGIGTFLPSKGMVDITNSLVALAKRQGVYFHFDEKVTRIISNKKRANGLLVEKNNKDVLLNSDVVISNMDVTPTYRKLLPYLPEPSKILSQEPSSSALIFYWGIKGKFSELNLHNILFSKDYKSEFDCLFNSKTLTADPTVYINITSKDLPQDAPNNSENWFVMINVPSNNGQDWDLFRERARQLIIDKIYRLFGRDISSLIECEDYLDPRRIESRTSSEKGSLYGSSSNSAFSAFLRHPNQKALKNLYFCGGSAHPGGGIPLCLLSARIVSDAIS